MLAEKDQTVDKNDTRHLFALANEPKMLWEADSDHDIMIDQPKELKKRVLKFLQKYI